MKKLSIGILLFFVFAITAIAQTREETEAWIIKQVEFNLEGRLKYSIEGDELISRLTLPYRMGGETIQKSIPINQIKSISFTHTHEFLSYSLICDKPCVSQFNGDTQSEDMKPRFLFEIYKKLDSSFLPRMDKALLKLIELHGGKAKIVQQKPEKETF